MALAARWDRALRGALVETTPRPPIGFPLPSASFSQGLQGGIAQSDRIALALLRQRDDLPGDDLGRAVGAGGQAERAQAVLECRNEQCDLFRIERAIFQQATNWHVNVGGRSPAPIKSARNYKVIVGTESVGSRTNEAQAPVDNCSCSVLTTPDGQLGARDRREAVVRYPLRAKVGRQRRPLTDPERDLAAQAIVEHLKLCNWKIEPGPPATGHPFRPPAKDAE
jgi:hypothetical protein